MKTDRFTDSIRRKLESIRPEFSENDWLRMQATLQQASPSQPSPTGNSPSPVAPSWTAQPWLMAAATISTVALITLSVWQRREITQLRETIAQANQQKSTAPAPTPANANDRPIERSEQREPSTDGLRPEALNAAPSGGNQLGQTVRSGRDTVYITRYVPMPTQQKATEPTLPVQREAIARQRYATAKPKPAGVDNEVAYNTPIPNQNLDLNDKLSTPNSLSRRTRNNQSTASNREANRIETGQERPEERVTYNTSQSTPSSDTPGVTATTSSAISSANSPSEVVVSAPTAPVELAASRPLALQSIDWNTVLSNRARRLRPARASVPATQPTVSKPVEQLAFKLRLGAGGDVTAHMWSVGGLAEVAVGDHFTLSAGLSRSTYLMGTFLTDEDFNVRTHRDFRRQIARGIDPRSDILNIDTRMIRIQIPISLGYRIPISRSFTLLPSVGTYLNLSNTENVTFYYRMMPLRGYDTANFKNRWPVDVLNNINLATSLEWHGGHWAAQAGPIATMRLQQPNFPNSQQENGIGLRARVFYQF
ncbi:hypothetical protein GCM10027341_12060 [Spirosoma knui]